MRRGNHNAAQLGAATGLLEMPLFAFAERSLATDEHRLSRMRREDLRAAETKRDAGIKQSAENAGERWCDRAYAHLTLFASRQSAAWSAEEAVAWCYGNGLDRPVNDERAFGGVFLRLSRAGVIVKSAEWYERSKGHKTRAQKWLSVIK